MFSFQTLSNTYKSQSLSLSSLSPIFPLLFVGTILSLESTPFNEISVASSFSRHLFCSYQASFSSWENLFVFNVKRNLPDRVTTLTFYVSLPPQVPPLRESTGRPAAATGLSPPSLSSSSCSSSCRGDTTELQQIILMLEKLYNYNVKCNVK